MLSLWPKGVHRNRFGHSKVFPSIIIIIIVPTCVIPIGKVNCFGHLSNRDQNNWTGSVHHPIPEKRLIIIHGWKYNDNFRTSVLRGHRSCPYTPHAIRALDTSERQDATTTRRALESLHIMRAYYTVIRRCSAGMIPFIIYTRGETWETHTAHSSILWKCHRYTSPPSPFHVTLFVCIETVYTVLKPHFYLWW